MSIRDYLIKASSEAIRQTGNKLNPEHVVDTILSYENESDDFKSILNSKHPLAMKALVEQVAYIAALGLDPLKGKNLVYVKTKNVNISKDPNSKNFIKLPDISESYHGVIKVLRDAGIVNDVVALHVYENYEVDYSGKLHEEPKVINWKVSPSARGEYRGCFIVLYLPSNSEAYPLGIPRTSFYHVEDIEETHKKFSKSVKTWTEHRLAMTAKSAIIEAVRYLDKSECKTVVEMLDHYNQDHDWNGQIEENPKITEYISNDQVVQIKNKLTAYGIERGFMAWLANSKKVKSIENIPDHAFDDVMEAIERNNPANKVAA